MALPQRHPDLMDYVAVPVDRAADAYATVRTFADAAWDWLYGRGG